MITKSIEYLDNFDDLEDIKNLNLKHIAHLRQIHVTIQSYNDLNKLVEHNVISLRKSIDMYMERVDLIIFKT